MYHCTEELSQYANELHMLVIAWEFIEDDFSVIFWSNRLLTWTEGGTLPNMPAYHINPLEYAELKQQVDELMETGFISESLSSC